MPSTKIINVLKDDKFEEILDLFKNTQAKEVIFVLPKTSKAFKNEGHFVILENEANKSNKRVSLLCSNPDTNKLANKYNFDVLLAKDNGSKPLITAVNQFDPRDDKEDEAESKEAEEEVVEEREPQDEKTKKIKPEEEYEPEESDDKSSFPIISLEDDVERDGYEAIAVSKINRGLD